MIPTAGRSAVRPPRRGRAHGARRSRRPALRPGVLTHAGHHRARTGRAGSLPKLPRRLSGRRDVAVSTAGGLVPRSHGGNGHHLLDRERESCVHGRRTVDEPGDAGDCIGETMVPMTSGGRLVAESRIAPCSSSPSSARPSWRTRAWRCSITWAPRRRCISVSNPSRLGPCTVAAHE